LNTNKPKSCTN